MDFLFVCYPLFLTALKFNFSVPLFYLSTSIYLSRNCSIESRTVAFAYHGDKLDDHGTLRVMCGVCGCVREPLDAISVHGIIWNIGSNENQSHGTVSFSYVLLEASGQAASPLLRLMALQWEVRWWPQRRCCHQWTDFSFNGRWCNTQGSCLWPLYKWWSMSLPTWVWER